MKLLVLLLAAAAAAAAAPRDADGYHPSGAAQLRSGDDAGAPEPGPAERRADYWHAEAQAALAARLAAPEPPRAARSVIMFLGDGLSVPTLAAARALQGQLQGRPGEEARLAFETFPVTGLAKTYCVDAQIPDSACTATAYLCGSKGNLGTVGVSGGVPRGACAAAADPALQVQSLAAWAMAAGRSAGLVTTTRVTHASPAGVYAHSAERDWESDADIPAECRREHGAQADIAHQLVHSFPGNRLKVILGGGRREFLPNSTVDEEGARGRRLDGRDLVGEWRADKRARNASHSYVWDRAGLLAAPADDDYLLGLFESSHMQYHAEADAAREPSLAELTEAAIARLSRNPRGYFLFVEGGRIDHAHHDNLPRLALLETLQLSEAVARAARLAAPDTLLLLTADHAHVMTYNGYSRRGNPVLGLSGDAGRDGKPYLTLSYTNGPGYRPHGADGRPDVSADDYLSPWYQRSAMVPLASETHGGEDVAVFARGPGQHVFTGLYEQSQLPHLMGYAACLGPGRHACHDHHEP
ncbi:hypothetical protein JYU34_001347 [Plutella xylostella]|uniref:Alkaline phosphatase n=1 Tax=Plutella xylostella TaxID=51655 RepID=A0ABQ7R3S0_PLUXY|nr:hypothetical protein JYU34_001347 [Plutella xylostella]